MNLPASLILAATLAAAATATSPAARADTLKLTINSAGSDNTPDDRLTLVEAIAYLNDEIGQVSGNDAVHGLGRALSVGESTLVVKEDSAEQAGLIRFDIGGGGPHVITAPAGGFPILFASRVTLDGYSQPGAAPNSNPITGTNNASLRLVLDARTLTPHPVTGEQPDYTLQIRGDGVVVRGFSVLASRETDNYGIYFGEGARGGSVNGCWLGLSPDQATFAGGEVAVAAYGAAGGQVFGTNGDGVDDRAEFNVIVAHAIGVQFEDTRDIRVSGNFIGVLPDGKSLPPADVLESLEGDAVEGAGLSGTLLIGSDLDGKGDAEEPNLIGGMKDDVIEFYGDVEGVSLAGNWIGVSADGSTPLPFGKLLRARAGRFDLGTPASVTQVDPRRANTIANGTSYLVRHQSGCFVSLRGNRLFNNTAPALRDQLAASLHGQILGRDTDLNPVLEAVVSPTEITGTLPVSAPGANGLLPALVDVYIADAATLENAPQGLHHVATFMDNGMMDGDPTPGRFKYSLAAATAPAAGLYPVVIASTIRNDDGFETSGFSNPVQVQLAGPSSGDVLNNVPMQGSMVHVNLRHRLVAGAPTLEVHLDPSIPVLTPLAVSHPGVAFDPAHPWFPDLDPSRGGYAFNRQYGFLLDGESDPLAEGHAIRIRQRSAAPGLLVRRYRQSPPAWEPMFGQNGSPEVFEWNLLMFHAAYAIPPEHPGPVEAEYEAYVVDGAGERVGNGATFKLVWNVAQGLTLNRPRFAASGLEVEAVLPSAWNGWNLRLERRLEAAAGDWAAVQMLMSASAGTNLLRDPNPPVGAAFYRARAAQP